MNNRSLWLMHGLMILLATLLVGCTSEEEDNTTYPASSTMSTATSTAFKMTSYNVGLVDGGAFNPPHSNERLPQILDAVKNYDADVICFQEVWSDKNVATFKESLKDRFPYQYNVRTPQVIESAKCTSADIVEISACGKSSCGSVATNELTACILSKCQTAVTNLTKTNPACFGAVAAQAGLDFDTALKNVLEPTGKYANNGSHGVLLVSKKELENKDVLIYESTNIHRAAIYATINSKGKKNHLVCAHLTANLGASVPYSGPYGSWENEGNLQAQQLIEFVAKKSSAGEPQFLAGDFNCSIESKAGGVINDFESNCQKFLDAGYQDAVHSQAKGCTFCSTNKLTIEGGENVYNGKPYDALLDHIFTKNTVDQSQLTAKIVFTQLVDIVSSFTSKMINTNLSDHYGVEITVP